MAQHTHHGRGFIRVAVIALALAAAAPALGQDDDDPSNDPAIPLKEFWVGLWGSSATTYLNCSQDNPFLSLDQARAQVRAFMIATGYAVHDIKVHVAGGLYRMTGPATFEPADSGWVGHPITYQAWDPNGIQGYDGDDVLFSGGMELTGWTATAAPSGVVAYTATVPEGLTGFRDLWVNNQRMVRARFPNIRNCTNPYSDPITPPCQNWGLLNVDDVDARLESGVRIQRLTVSTVPNASCGTGTCPIPTPIGDGDPNHNVWSQVEVVAHRLYINPQQRVGSGQLTQPTIAVLDFPITSVATGQPAPNQFQDVGALGPFRWDGWQPTSPAPYLYRFLEVSGTADLSLPANEGGPRGPVTQVFLCNDLAFLDADREWHFDPAQNKVWLKLCESPAVSGAVVTIPLAQKLLVLSGAAHLRFHGLDWAHTHQPMPTQFDGSTPGYATVQQGLQWRDGSGNHPVELNNVVSPAIEMRAAFDCRLTRCRIAHTGGSAVVIGTAVNSADEPTLFAESHSNIVDTCEIFDVGGHGVYIGDDYGRRAGSWGLTPSNAQSDPSELNMVVNSRIDTFGVIYKDSAGVYLAHTRDSIVADNEVSRGNWSAIVAGGVLHAHQWTPPSPLPPCSPNVVRNQTGEGTGIVRNNIHRNMLKLHDGGVYMQGSHIASQRSGAPATLHGNYIHDTVLNPFLNYQTDNAIGLYFETGSSGWDVRSNYVERVQKLFFFNHKLRLVSGVCTDSPSILRCADGVNVFGQSSSPVPWSEECGGFTHQFPGQTWDPGFANYWHASTGGAYGVWSNCRGSTAMPAASNIQQSLPSNHPIIQNAGPDDLSWFLPLVTPERIHPAPVCGSDTQIEQ